MELCHRMSSGYPTPDQMERAKVVARLTKTRKRKLSEEEEGKMKNDGSAEDRKKKDDELDTIHERESPVKKRKGSDGKSSSKRNGKDVTRNGPPVTRLRSLKGWKGDAARTAGKVASLKSEMLGRLMEMLNLKVLPVEVRTCSPSG